MRRAFAVATVLTIVAIQLLALGRGGSAAAQDAGATADGSGFAGAWRVTITPEGGPSFTGLSTYAADGSIASSILPVQPVRPGAPEVAFVSGGHGMWEATGDDTAIITIVHLRAGADGAFLGAITVRGEFSLDDDGRSFAGEFARTVTAPDGAELMVVRGTVEGARIDAEPPDASPASPAA